MAEPYTPAFRTMLDYFTEDEIESLPIYEFLKHHGFETCAATLFQGAGDEKVMLAFEGFETQLCSQEMARQLDVLRPHLARAAVLSSQFQLERIRAAMAAMQMVNVPAAMVDRGGRLLLANAIFNGLVGQKMFDRRDRLYFADPQGDVQYVRSMRTLAEGPSGRTVVLRRENGLPLAMHVVPVRGSARDIFQRAAAILVIATGAANASVPPILLQNLFDLSPAESRIASLLCDGLRLSEIAARCSLSDETVRSHLKSAFTKTDTNRQADLVALLARYSRPPTLK